MSKDMYGVLQLSTGKTFGRQLRPNGRPGKLYYGIHPMTVDSVLAKVPYEVKYEGTSRCLADKYVSYRVVAQKDGERCEARIVETFGDVSNVEAWGEFNLVSRGLQRSSNIGKGYSVSNIDKLGRFSLQRCDESIITVDPIGCKDIDDGFGITRLDNGNYCLYVCITHVPNQLIRHNITSETLITGLRSSCSVYFPWKTIHMFNERFAVEVLSLNAGKHHDVLRFAMTVSSLGEILDSKFDVCSVYVEKNYDYESTELSVLPMYVELSRVVKLMNEKHPVPFMTLVENSHDVVQYLMILMNEACGLYLFDFCENGLLREQSDSLLQNAAVPDELMPFKQQLQSGPSKYVTSCQSKPDKYKYAHVTSPMRRLADIVNMILVSRGSGWTDNGWFYEFMTSSRVDAGTISLQCKLGRRLGLDANLLDLFLTQSNEASRQIHIECYVVNQEQGFDIVFSPLLKRTFRVKQTRDRRLWEKITCEVVVFELEHTTHKKIRLVEV